MTRTNFSLKLSDEAQDTIDELEKNPSKKGLSKQVKKSLGYLQRNPKHPSLNTHSYDTIPNPLNPKEKVFGAYAQNHTPSAHRILFCYGPDRRTIFIIAIIPHL